MQNSSILLTIAVLLTAAPALAQSSGANSGNINTPSAQTSKGATAGTPHTIYQGNSANQRISTLPPCYLGGPSAGKTLAPIFGTGGSMAGTQSGPGGANWSSDPGPSGTAAAESDTQNSDMSDSLFGIPDPTDGGDNWGWLLN